MGAVSTGSFIYRDLGEMVVDIEEVFKEIYWAGHEIIVIALSSSYQVLNTTMHFLAIKIFKIADRASKFAQACDEVSEKVMAKRFLPAPAHHVFKVITSFVKARNISDRWEKKQEDFIPSPLGLKKTSFVLMVTGNLFETYYYVKGFESVNKLLAVSQANIQQLAGLVAGAIGSLQIHGYGVQQLLSLEVQGVSAQQLLGIAGSMDWKIFMQSCIAFSFALNVIAITQSILLNPRLSSSRKEKLIWTAAEHAGKAALIVTSGSLGSVPFAFLAPGTWAFLLLSISVNTLAFAKVVKFDCNRVPA